MTPIERALAAIAEEATILLSKGRYGPVSELMKICSMLKSVERRHQKDGRP
jgi:hypothetical protein